MRSKSVIPDGAPIMSVYKSPRPNKLKGFWKGVKSRPRWRVLNADRLPKAPTRV